MPRNLPASFRRRLPLVGAGVGMLLYLTGSAAALEIFRIGGLGPPAGEPGVTVHHIPWTEFVAGQGIDPDGLAGGVMRPVFIAPGVDIAATSLARGGGPHVQSGHGRSNVVTDESKNMVDGDPETVYEWLEVSVASQ